MAKFDPKKADLNKDGKLSDYESNVGQKRAAAMKMDKKSRKIKKIEKTSKQIIDTPNPIYMPNVSKKDSKKYYRKKEKFSKTAQQVDQINSPMKKYGSGYAMKMGSKEVNSPSAFNMKDAANMAASPMMVHKDGHEGDLKPGQTVELNSVTGLGDPLFKHKKYKKELQSAQDEVSTAVIRKFKQDSARTGITTGEYNNPYARYSVPQRSMSPSSKYNIDMATFGDQPGVSPKIYMKGDRMKGGYDNEDRSGFKTNRGDLIGKYQKMSDSLYGQKKKAIDLKFYGSK